jgi:two-component system cell cycle sensor histidine kinase/response regulator CckA
VLAFVGVVAIAGLVELAAALRCFTLAAQRKPDSWLLAIGLGALLLAVRNGYLLAAGTAPTVVGLPGVLIAEIAVLLAMAMLLAVTWQLPRQLGSALDEAQTNRAQAERLADSEAQHRLVLERVPEAFVVLIGGQVAYANRAFSKIFGVKHEDGAYRPLGSYLQERFRAMLADPMSGAVDVTMTWGSRRMETEIERTNGEKRWVEIRRLQLMEWDRQAAEVYLIADITDRRRAEEALRESEERFREYFDNANIGLFRTTPDGRILMANRTLSTMLGCSSFEELAALNLNERFMVSDSGRHRFLEALDRKGEIRGLETTWRRADGSKITVIENARVVREPSGAARYFDGTVEDVSERKALHERLGQLERIESIGNLAGGIAHDFNNLLLAIMASTELLLRRNVLTGDALGELETIQRTAQRAASLTQRLLAFARRQTLEPLDLNLNDLVHEVLPVLQRLIPEHFDLEFIPGLSIHTVQADKGQIEQVLLNLCINARDAMANGGVITIKTENAEVGAEFVLDKPWAREGRYVRLSIIDRGEGMAPETMAHIFEPFFTTKGVGKGTGLGLSTLYGIVKQHGGMVDVTSKVGEGSTFEVYLPAVERAARALETIAAPAVVGGTEKILVVEDEPEVRNALTEILTGLGYDVLPAADGLEGLELLREHRERILLVITDVVMPRMGGKDLWEAAQSISPATSFLFSSGYAENTLDEHMLGRPGVFFLSKPYGIDVLAHRVRTALDSRRDRGEGRG